MSTSAFSVIAYTRIVPLCIRVQATACDQVTGGLPIHVRLSLISLAYGEGPFTLDGLGIQDAMWSAEPFWNATLLMARCLYLGIPRLPLVHDGFLTCLANAWSALIRVDWGGCHDLIHVPIFGMAFRLHQIALATIGLPDTCDNDTTWRNLLFEASSIHRWTDVSDGAVEAAMVKQHLDHANHEVLNSIALVGDDVDVSQLHPNSSADTAFCTAHRHASLVLYTEPKVWWAKIPRADFARKVKALMLIKCFQPSDIFRHPSPLWRLLQRREVIKFSILPGRVWTRVFLGEVLGVASGGKTQERSITVFEAGAKNGDDTIAMCEMWPDAIIHAAEPVPEQLEKARDRLYQHANCLHRVHLYDVALGKESGIANIQLTGGSMCPACSTLFNYSVQHEHMVWNRFGGKPPSGGAVPVRVVTLDSWARETNVAKVDVIRLDMEGSDFLVVQASIELLPSATILQVEVFPDGSFLGSGASSVGSFQKLMRSRGWHLLWTNVGVTQHSGWGDAIFLSGRTVK